MEHITLTLSPRRHALIEPLPTILDDLQQPLIFLLFLRSPNGKLLPMLLAFKMQGNSMIYFSTAT
jgi:hypothetical protein